MALKVAGHWGSCLAETWGVHSDDFLRYVIPVESFLALSRMGFELVISATGWPGPLLQIAQPLGLA